MKLSFIQHFDHQTRGTQSFSNAWINNQKSMSLSGSISSCSCGSTSTLPLRKSSIFSLAVVAMTLFASPIVHATPTTDASIFQRFESSLVRLYAAEGRTALEGIRDAVHATPEILDILENSARLQACLQETKLVKAPFSSLGSAQAIEQLKGAVAEFKSSTESDTAAEKIKSDINNLVSNHLEVDEYFNTILQRLSDGTTGIAFEHFPEPMGGFVKAIVENYFSEVADEIRARMIAGHLALDSSASDDEQLTNLLMSSGPVMHKLVQLVANESKSPALKRILDAFKTTNNNMSDNELELALSESFGDATSGSFPFLNFDRKPISIATVAQVHTAVLKHTDHKVAVKIKKPKLAELAAPEFNLMFRLVELRGIIGGDSIIRALQMSFDHELDFIREIENLKRGFVLYNKPKENISSVQLAPGIDSTNNAIVMMFEEGSDITDVDQMHAKRELLTSVLKMWFTEALFKSGFFHADIHEGNRLFFYKTQKKCRVILLDYGSCANFKKEHQNALVNLLAATEFRKARLVLRSLKLLTSMDAAQEAVLLPIIQKVLATHELTGAKVSTIFQRASENHMELPPEFVSFNRGWLLLEQQLKEAIEQLGEQLGKKTAKEEVDALYGSIVKKGILAYWSFKQKAGLVWYLARR